MLKELLCLLMRVCYNLPHSHVKEICMSESTPRRNRKKALENLSQQAAGKYYTAQEAQKRLGMTRDMFNHHVKQGAIKKTTLVGSHGYYLKAEIDALAEKIEYTLLIADIPSLEYRTATFNDLEDLNRMAYLNFGEFSRSPERVAARRRFLEVNPHSTFVLYNYHALVASLDIVPLQHEAILEFREGKRGWQFPNEMIEQFEPGHRLECIIIDTMTTTNAPITLYPLFFSTYRRTPNNIPHISKGKHIQTT